MILVLDAGALIAMVKGEQGGETVDSLLSDPANICMAHAVNLCEVYYDMCRLTDEARAKETISRLIMAGLYVREDMDTEFWQEAGNHKATIRRISLADCFCMTLANRLGVELVTADRHDSRRLPNRDCAR